MPLLHQLQKLANASDSPCVTVSLNTHRTHPDNLQDAIIMKNLLAEAETRVIAEFGKRPVAHLLAKINGIAETIDINYNLDSLHIFLSNETTEIVKSPWETNQQGVHISDSFAIRPLVKAANRAQEYMILVLSQSGVSLYEAVNDAIVGEIKSEGFPFSENPHYTTHADKASDSKLIDNLLREFLNKVDKAVVKVNQENGLPCVVVATEENFTKLMQVADKPRVYCGLHLIDYNNAKPVHLVKHTWEIVKKLQHAIRTEGIKEMKEAVSRGRVLTDLQDIYRAAIDGNAELLIVHQDYVQPVIMNDERSFSLIDDATVPNSIDDIISNISWEILKRKGRVFYTSQEEIKDLGQVALKTRY